MLNFATIEYNNMLVTFGEQYLEDLYMKGKAEGKKHRYQPQIIRGYQKAV